MRFNRGNFVSALAGLIAGALLIGALPGMAATGDVAKMGQWNRAGKQTVFSAAAGTTLQVRNTKATGIPLRLIGDASIPPMEVNSEVMVDNLNADLLDGMDAEALAVPSGAVMFFDATTCPSGWSAYTKARGRTVVGLQPGGTLGGTLGGDYNFLLDLDWARAFSGGMHNHVWSWFRQTNRSWHTYDINGDGKALVAWADGIDTVGEGYFPLMTHDDDRTGTEDVIYYTMNDGFHDHDVNMPYVQLLACKKT